MSKEKDVLPSDWVQKKMASLRQQLQEPGNWPVTADALFLHLVQPPQPVTDKGDIEEMMSLVVNDALAGIDIAERYPEFYAKMLSDTQFYQAFLDILNLLEADYQGELSALPQPADRNLHFLNQPSPLRPVIEQEKLGEWHITWRLLSEHLQSWFFTTPEPAYRSGDRLLEDDSTTLIQELVQIGDQSMDVLLEAVRPVNRPDMMHLNVLAVIHDDQSLKIRANIRWGSYTAMSKFNIYGRAAFPPFLLDKILDESGQFISSDLEFHIEMLPT